MSRPQINHESMPARLPEGTLARMDAVLGPREKRADLIRVAIERELKRRERQAKTKVQDLSSSHQR
jgi:hypothetical protein